MNEIAKMLKAYERFWADIENLFNDFSKVMEDNFKMSIFEEYQSFKNTERYYINYFKEKILFYIIFESKSEIPFLQLFCLQNIDGNNQLNNKYLEENWKNYDPIKLIDEDEYETSKLNESIFSIMIDYGKCYVSEKIDITSIDSTNVINEDLKYLVEALISNKKEKEYKPKIIKFI